MCTCSIQTAYFTITAACSLAPEMPFCLKQPLKPPKHYKTPQFKLIHVLLAQGFLFEEKKAKVALIIHFLNPFPFDGCRIVWIFAYNPLWRSTLFLFREKEKKVLHRSINSSTCPVANGENMSMWIIVLSPWIKISLGAFKIPLRETIAKSICYLAC